MPTSDFDRYCRQIVERFLLTAVVVDDEPYVPIRPTGDITTPPRGHLATAGAVDEPSRQQRQDLNVPALTNSFAKHGMVCGVVIPGAGLNEPALLSKALGRADILILDWQLHRDNGKSVLGLLEAILKGDDGGRMRLIAVYTGEYGLQTICDTIVKRLECLQQPVRSVETSETGCGILFGPCSIQIYAKCGGRTSDPQERKFVEKDLPDRLISDFATMVNGLLPSLALTALTAVRENVYRVLERFGAELDPAFLTHRACLESPWESEQHIVEQIASELQGVMLDAVVLRKPTAIKLIELWLTRRSDIEEWRFGSDKKLSVSQTVTMLTRGAREKHGPLKANGNDYDILSDGFSRGSTGSEDLDLRLASAMCFRMVLDGESRFLWMGTVLRSRTGNDDEKLFLCITPKCDSVRLEEELSSFLFVPLTKALHNKLQLVVPLGGTEAAHRRMTVSKHPATWVTKAFKVNQGLRCVVAQRDQESAGFVFEASGASYEWVGELKAEFAQTVAQDIAQMLSRVPLNKSEWLRRVERDGKKNK